MLFLIELLFQPLVQMFLIIDNNNICKTYYLKVIMQVTLKYLILQGIANVRDFRKDLISWINIFCLLKYWDYQFCKWFIFANLASPQIFWLDTIDCNHLLYSGGFYTCMLYWRDWHDTSPFVSWDPRVFCYGILEVWSSNPVPWHSLVLSQDIRGPEFYSYK